MVSFASARFGRDDIALVTIHPIRRWTLCMSSLASLGRSSQLRDPSSIPALKTPTHFLFLIFNRLNSTTEHTSTYQSKLETMKLTSFLLAFAIPPLALAVRLPTQPDIVASDPTTSEVKALTFGKKFEDLLSRRSLIDDMVMKEKCKPIFKSDKAKYRDACANEADEDARNLCMLRSLLGDAPADCRAAMVKSMDF